MNQPALGNDVRGASTGPQLSAIGLLAKDRFRLSGYRALGDVSCVADDGVAYLHGCLPSYYLKQLAQEIAAGVDGVRFVVNKIEVTAPASRRRQA